MTADSASFPFFRFHHYYSNILFRARDSVSRQKYIRLRHDLNIGDTSYEHAQDKDAVDSNRLPLHPETPQFSTDSVRPATSAPWLGFHGNAVVSSAPTSPAWPFTSSGDLNRTRDAMATANSSDNDQTQCGPPIHLNPALVYGASVQLPTFDKAEPNSWFRIADANFGLQKVTDSKTKYWYVLSKLDSTNSGKAVDVPRPSEGRRPLPGDSQQAVQDFWTPAWTEAGRSPGHERRRWRIPCRVWPVTTAPPLQRLHRRHPQTDISPFSPPVNRDCDHRQPLCGFRDGHGSSRQGLDGNLSLRLLRKRRQLRFRQLAPTLFNSRWRKLRTRGTSARILLFRPNNDPHALLLLQKVWRLRQEVRPGLFSLEWGSSSRRTCHARLPRGRGPWRWRLQHWQVEKLVGRSPSVAGPQQPSTSYRPSQLGLIIDDCSRKRCLLDTGSQVSLWPPSLTSPKLSISRVRLMAANGTLIKAQQRREIQIGGKSYSFVFNCASFEADTQAGLSPEL